MSEVLRRIVTIACIVEGHGEVHALPLLLRRIASAVDPGTHLRLRTLFRMLFSVNWEFECNSPCQ